MKEISISKDLKLPTNTVTQKLAFLGTTGSGKTYGASKLAEELSILNYLRQVINYLNKNNFRVIIEIIK